MEPIAVLDLKEEFNHLINYLNQTWSFTDPDEMLQAAKDAFNAGLRDGRLWCDQHITYRIGEHINSDNEMCPLPGRREMKFECGTFVYDDALIRFDSFLSQTIRQLSTLQTRYGKWDYSRSADNVTRDVSKNYPSIQSAAPLEVSRHLEKSLIAGYTGFPCEGLRCYSTPKRLAYSMAKYDKEEQGRNFVRTLLSTIYSHGLGCAAEHNDRSLIVALAPIYSEFRQKPLCTANGAEILGAARQHEILTVLEAINACEFHEPKPKQQVTGPTTKVNAEQLIADILAELETDEHKQKELAEQQRIDQLISSFKQQLPTFEI